MEERFSLTVAQCRGGHGRRALSSAEAELYAIGSGAIDGLGAAQLLKEWQCETVPLLWTDSQSALAVCRRRGPGRMKHIELKMLAVQEWLKTGRLRVRKISTHDNPANPHDQGHVSRKTDQVWTSLDPTRITLHRLEPTCTATAVTSDVHSQQLPASDTTLLSAETLSVDSFSASAFWPCNTRRKTCERLQIHTSICHNHSPQQFTSNSSGYSAQCNTTETSVLIEYDSPIPILVYAVLVTTMTVPTTVVTQPE